MYNDSVTEKNNIVFVRDMAKCMENVVPKKNVQVRNTVGNVNIRNMIKLKLANNKQAIRLQNGSVDTIHFHFIYKSLMISKITFVKI